MVMYYPKISKVQEEAVQSIQATKEKSDKVWESDEVWEAVPKEKKKSHTDKLSNLKKKKTTNKP